MLSIRTRKGKGKKEVISDCRAKKQRNNIINKENEQDNPTDSSIERNMDLLEVPKLANSHIIKQEFIQMENVRIEVGLPEVDC